MATARRSALLTFTLLLSASVRGGEAPRFTDELGRELTPRSWPVERVVCLAPSVTEILFAIGAGPILVGRDSFSDYPEEALRVASVGSDYEPSVERILGLRPDVVFTATTANQQNTVEALARLRIPVYVTRTESLAELETTTVGVGRVVSRDAEARQLVSRLKAGLDDVRAAAAKAPKVKAMIVVWSDPLYVAGKGTYTSQLLEAAGGMNVAEDAGPGFPKYPLERVLRHAPDVIVISTHRDDPNPDPAGYWKRWGSLPAVASGRVHAIEGDVIVRPGPRLLEGARKLLQVLHPELSR